MKISQLSIFIENKEGRLSYIADVLGKASVDIRALSVADTTDFGILRIIVDNPQKAVKVLRENNITVSLTEVIAVGIDDKSGEFASIMDMLAKAHIEVEYMYAFISRDKGRAFLIIRVDDNQKAIKLLQSNNIELLTEEKIQNM